MTDHLKSVKQEITYTESRVRMQHSAVYQGSWQWCGVLGFGRLMQQPVGQHQPPCSSKPVGLLDPCLPPAQCFAAHLTVPCCLCAAGHGAQGGGGGEAPADHVREGGGKQGQASEPPAAPPAEAPAPAAAQGRLMQLLPSCCRLHPASNAAGGGCPHHTRTQPAPGPALVGRVGAWPAPAMLQAANTRTCMILVWLPVWRSTRGTAAAGIAAHAWCKQSAHAALPCAYEQV